MTWKQEQTNPKNHCGKMEALVQDLLWQKLSTYPLQQCRPLELCVTIICTHLLKLCIFLSGVGVVESHDELALKLLTVVIIQQSRLRMSHMEISTMAEGNLTSRQQYFTYNVKTFEAPNKLSSKLLPVVVIQQSGLAWHVPHGGIYNGRGKAT